MKHTKEQIENAICKWSTYLLEKKIATSEEIKSILNEGLFKRAMSAIKSGLSSIGRDSAFIDKYVSQKIHDTFAANKGVKKFMQAIKDFYKKGIEFKDIKIFVYFDKYDKTYPVADFMFSKNKKTLAVLFSDKNDKAKTFADLYKIMKDSGMTGGKKKLSDFTDALVVGKIEGDSAILSESIQSKDISRI